MPDAFMFDMPVKLSMPILPSIRPDCVDAERELLNDIVDEANRTLLIMLFIDPKSTNPSCIIYRGVLIASDLFTLLGC